MDVSNVHGDVLKQRN